MTIVAGAVNGDVPRVARPLLPAAAAASCTTIELVLSPTVSGNEIRLEEWEIELAKLCGVHWLIRPVKDAVVRDTGAECDPVLAARSAMGSTRCPWAALVAPGA